MISPKYDIGSKVLWKKRNFIGKIIKSRHASDSWQYIVRITDLELEHEFAEDELEAIKEDEMTIPFILLAYLANVISYTQKIKVTNIYGHEWEAFMPLVNLLEENAGLLLREEIEGFRANVYRQWQEQRMDLLCNTLTTSTLWLLEHHQKSLAQYMNLFSLQSLCKILYGEK
jgi:hypothetical protein